MGISRVIPELALVLCQTDLEHKTETQTPKTHFLNQYFAVRNVGKIICISPSQDKCNLLDIFLLSVNI